MSSFAFVGQVSASRSIMLRLLLARSFAPALPIRGESDQEEVRLMERALAALVAGGRELEVGPSTVLLRFLALRAAHMGGEFILKGSKDLFGRSHVELVKILRQLSVDVEMGGDRLKLNGSGWRLQGDTLLVPFTGTSQFASAVLLNAWGLPFDLFVSLGGQKVSEGHWRMSVRVAQELGMRIDFWDGDFRVPRGQKINTNVEFPVEMDMNAVFALAALAAVSGTASFPDFPISGLQPEAEFVKILPAMGVPLVMAGTTLKVDRAAKLNGVSVNLRNCPDLFPVLASLCALAGSDSHLYGLTQSAIQETNRLGRMADMIRAFGGEVEVTSDGLKISGSRSHSTPADFDCGQDTALANALKVLRAR